MINLAGDGEPERVAAAEVSEHFFNLLGVTPIRGRTFLRSEESAEHPFVAISVTNSGSPVMAQIRL